MRRIAITGHVKLTRASVPLITNDIVLALAGIRSVGITGISCLARGADSIFAQAVLGSGGSLEVIIPSVDYRARKVGPDYAAQFDELVSKASSVHVMPFENASRVAYEAANDKLLSTCDTLFAVWDGQACLDQGGTAAAVAEARSRGIPVQVIWPAGAARDPGAAA